MPKYKQPGCIRGLDALGSPAGTDGLNSVGMITGRMEVRNQQGRDRRKGVQGKGGWVNEGERAGRKGEGMIRAGQM